MRTACLFWPGSEAEIAGHRPSWYAVFDNKTQATDDVEKARIDNAVALLKMPEAERPHFITIYYSEPDHEGHEYRAGRAGDQGCRTEDGCDDRQAEEGSGCDEAAD